jgi:sugar phosphate isomerase/epimerase
MHPDLPSRRSFLATLTVAAAATLTRFQSLHAAAIPQGAFQSGFAVGPQAWSFRMFSVQEAIAKAAEAGAKCIELFPGQKFSANGKETNFDHNSPTDHVAAVQALLKEKGVAPMAYGVVGLSKDEATTRKVFEFCKTVGIGIINSEPPAEALDTIEKCVKEFDIKVGFHNHPKRENDANYKHWDPQWVLSVTKDRDPRIGACADTGHWMRSGIDPVEAVKLLKGRVVSSHLKDRQDWAGPDVPFGTGTGKVKEVLDELVAQGFKGSLSIEYETKWENNLLDVKQCVEFVRSYKV